MFFSKKFKRVTSMLTIALMLVAMVVTAPTASACTALELTSAEGDVYWFRTCDMDNSYNVFGENGSYIAASYLVSYPKGEAIPFVTGDVVADHTVIGMSFSDSYALLDGINDAGLTGGLLFLDEGTETLDENVPEGNEVMSAMEGVTYILAQCGTIDEVIALCERTNIQALDVPGIPGSDLTATLHFNFVDPTGRGIVIEAADPDNAGFYTVYESIGVMTNSPPYDWQMDNFEKYIGESTALGEKGIDSIVLEGMTIEGNDQGGEQNMPGSMSAPDRLVRLAMSRYFCAEGNNIPNENMLAQGAGIMATNNRPVNDTSIEGSAGSYTQYTVAYDISNQTMYIRPYDTVVWTSLSMDEVTATTRTEYPIMRGNAGASVSTLSLNAEEAPAAGPAIPTTVLVGAVAVLALAVVVLLIKLGKKEDAMAK